MTFVRRDSWAAVSALILAALVNTGCEKTAAPKKTSGAAADVQIDPSTAGTISGTIHLTGKTPGRIEIDMAQDPACSLSDQKNFSEQYVGKPGRLANVFITVKDGLGNKVYAAPTAPVVLDQRGCRYLPHVLGVQAGTPVEFRNSDPTMHNIHTTAETPANPEVDISQPPKGGTMQKVFANPELMIPVRCNNHPWMNAFVNVAANPFFAVSDDDGHFEIKGLPPGTYTLVADHEVLGQQTASVTVGPKQTATTNFSYGAPAASGR